MKKTLIRAISFFLTLSLLTGLLIPFASAIEYEGVESMTVDATAALLIDLDTDQVLYEQAADEQRYPASITKIMTALLTLEAIGRGELDLNTEITVDAAALADITEDSSTANLQAGEKITVKNLLYCLLLASANEAANVLAMAVSGDIPTFVELMNQRAQELGMAGTHFVNPHGLHNADHYSTARDIYRMSKQAMTHATFREIVSTGRYTVPATNLSTQAAQYQGPADLRQALRLHHGRHHRHQNRQHRRGGLLPGGCGPEKGAHTGLRGFGGPKPHGQPGQCPAQAVHREQAAAQLGLYQFLRRHPAGCGDLPAGAPRPLLVGGQPRGGAAHPVGSGHGPRDL